MEISFKMLKGRDVAAHLNELARLRIEVFKESPYRYEGELDYERTYLRVYQGSKDRLVVWLKKFPANGI